MALAASPTLQKFDRLRFSLDIAERMFVVGLFVLFARGIISSVLDGSSPFNALMLVSEGVVVALVLFRRQAVELSIKPLDWVFAVGATAGPLMVRPGQVHALVAPGVAGALMLIGIVFQLCCKLTLRRSFGIAPANRGLAVKGLYRLVRHPIYLSYFIGQAGFLLLNPTVWNLGVLAVAWTLQILRIQAEERLLAQDPAHADFRAKVRFRLVPGLW